MRAVSYTMAKNEEDIIEMFIRHNLTIVDHMYISDNMSSDGTRAILNAMLDEGLPLTIWDDLDPAYTQSKKTTAAYHRIVAEDDVDVVYFVDADEFLWGKQPTAPVGGGVYELIRRKYIISDPSASGYKALSSMTRRWPTPETSKSMVFHGPNVPADIMIGMGNHHIYHGKDKLFSGVLPDLWIAHFPLRSKDQYIAKNLIGWMAYMLREEGITEKKNPLGYHWRNEYRYLKNNNGTLTDAQLLYRLYGVNDIEELLSKTESAPLNFNITLKYGHLVQGRTVLMQMIDLLEHVIGMFWEERRTRT